MQAAPDSDKLHLWWEEQFQREAFPSPLEWNLWQWKEKKSFHLDLPLSQLSRLKLVNVYPGKSERKNHFICLIPRRVSWHQGLVGKVFTKLLKPLRKRQEKSSRKHTKNLKTFPYEETQMVNKYMKRWSIKGVIRKMQTEATRKRSPHTHLTDKY